MQELGRAAWRGISNTVVWKSPENEIQLSPWGAEAILYRWEIIKKYLQLYLHLKCLCQLQKPILPQVCYLVPCCKPLNPISCPTCFSWAVCAHGKGCYGAIFGIRYMIQNCFGPCQRDQATDLTNLALPTLTGSTSVGPWAENSSFFYMGMWNVALPLSKASFQCRLLNS